jgi:tetratricopeptide (TPR) repeat protein
MTTTENNAAGVDPSEAYQAAVGEFSAAGEQMHRGEYDAARGRFEKLAAENLDEPALSERSRMFARVCAERSAPPETPRTDPESRYLEAVMLSNDGESDAAIAILTELFQRDPTSADYAYARACAYALKGNAEAAIGDLRQAISLDPTVRFQAVNDSDFEQIREEPAFIDIIEPTPSGA